MFKKLSFLLKSRYISKLLKRAGMNIYQYNTRVVFPTPDDEDIRILVSESNMRFDKLWGDCLSIGIMLEPGKPTIIPITLSPARARLLAHHLMEAASSIEKRQRRCTNIDKDISEGESTMPYGYR